MIRIGIVDDHYILLDGIKRLIEYDDIFMVVFQAKSGKECLEFLEKEENTIDILLLDIDMPGMNGFDVLENVKKKYFHIKTIFLTSFNDYVHFSYALNLGADGYLLKNTGFTELMFAIKEVNNGLFYIDKSLSCLLKRFIDDKEKTILTKREHEIMVCVASGMMNKEIAIDLKIREETVKRHLTKIFYKFHVNDRTQAVVYAVKHHYIEL